MKVQWVGSNKDSLPCWNASCEVIFLASLDFSPSPPLLPVVFCGVNFEIILLSFKLIVWESSQAVKCGELLSRAFCNFSPSRLYSEQNNKVMTQIFYNMEFTLSEEPFTDILVCILSKVLISVRKTSYNLFRKIHIAIV